MIADSEKFQLECKIMLYGMALMSAKYGTWVGHLDEGFEEAKRLYLENDR